MEREIQSCTEKSIAFKPSPTFSLVFTNRRQCCRGVSPGWLPRGLMWCSQLPTTSLCLDFKHSWENPPWHAQNESCSSWKHVITRFQVETGNSSTQLIPEI